MSEFCPHDAMNRTANAILEMATKKTETSHSYQMEFLVLYHRGYQSKISSENA